MILQFRSEPYIISIYLREFVILQTLENDTMNRRMFLISAGGVTVLTMSGTLLFSCRPLEYDARIVEPNILSQMWDTDTIVAIGRSYVSQTPEEKNENDLVKALIGSISGSTEEIVNTLNEKVKNDFYKGDIVMIDGWMLSRTEARQCGIISETQIK